MGLVFLAVYVATVGVATFLIKYAMDDLSPYQLNALMAFGMLATGIPAWWIAERTFSLPVRALPIGSVIGVLMGVGSIVYVLALNKLPAGLTAAAATSYVVIVIVLSRLVLAEEIGPLKGLGLALTLIGVAILSYENA